MGQGWHKSTLAVGDTPTRPGHIRGKSIAHLQRRNKKCVAWGGPPPRPRLCYATAYPKPSVRLFVVAGCFIWHHWIILFLWLLHLSAYTQEKTFRHWSPQRICHPMFVQSGDSQLMYFPIILLQYTPASMWNVNKLYVFTAIRITPHCVKDFILKCIPCLPNLFSLVHYFYLCATFLSFLWLNFDNTANFVSWETCLLNQRFTGSCNVISCSYSLFQYIVFPRN